VVIERAECCFQDDDAVWGPELKPSSIVRNVMIEVLDSGKGMEEVNLGQAA
jgi:hypothetical protein